MPAILALEKISKRFGAVVVADGINLVLEDGEALGIIGPNGAGKTTLFGMATGAVKRRSMAAAPTCSNAAASPTRRTSAPAG